MILSFINIRKLPREMLKTEGEHLPRDLANVNEWKSCLIPILHKFKENTPKIEKIFAHFILTRARLL